MRRSRNLISAYLFANCSVPEARSRGSGVSKGSRSVFVGHVCFWRPGVPRLRKPQIIIQNAGVLALPPWGARPTNHAFLEKVFVFWPWYPRPPKNTCPKFHFGIPLRVLLPNLMSSASSGCRCALLALMCVIGVVWAGPGPPV